MFEDSKLSENFEMIKLGKVIRLWSCILSIQKESKKKCFQTYVGFYVGILQTEFDIKKGKKS